MFELAKEAKVDKENCVVVISPHTNLNTKTAVKNLKKHILFGRSPSLEEKWSPSLGEKKIYNFGLVCVCVSVCLSVSFFFFFFLHHDQNGGWRAAHDDAK